MRLERFYTLVGLFIGGAVILMVMVALFFYNNYSHQKEGTYVMFFSGSIRGLDIASTVTYRGVKIGEVNLIELTEDDKDHEIKIPVYVQFYIEKSFIGKKNPVQLLIEQGYVAKVTPPNFLTGTASIDLVQDRDESGDRKIATRATYHDYPIFPTRTTVQKHMTMNMVLKTAHKTLLDISDLVSSPRVRETFDATAKMASNLETLATDLDQKIPGFIDIFDRSLLQFSAAANSMQNLTDYLAQHPESLLRGKR